jgi:hypothetical protein
VNERIKLLVEQATTKISFRLDPTTYKHIDDPEGDFERVEFDKQKFAELIIRDFIATCNRLASEAANDDDDSLNGLVGSGWNDGWINCAERLTEIVATDYNINHELFTSYDPTKPFFRNK